MEHRSRKDFRLELDISEWGYKFHMNDINATIGLSNLKGLNTAVNTHYHNYCYLNEKLTHLKNIELMEHQDNRKSAAWIYTIKTKNKQEFISFMKDRGVMASQVHNRNDKNSCVKEFRTELPQLDKLEQEMVCIPCGWWLTKDDLDYIIFCLMEWDSKL